MSRRIRTKKVLRLALMTMFVVFCAALAIVSFPASGWRALAVQTSSMAPSIPAGSLVFVHSVPPEQIQAGDVITYMSRTQDKTITHRVGHSIHRDNGPDTFITKGDANRAFDQPVFERQVIGRVQASVPFVGSYISYLRTWPGIIAFIYLPALLIVISEFKLLFRRIKEEDDKESRYSWLESVAWEKVDLLRVGSSRQRSEPARDNPGLKSKTVGLTVAVCAAVCSLILPTYAVTNQSVSLAGNTVSVARNGAAPESAPSSEQQVQPDQEQETEPPPAADLPASASEGLPVAEPEALPASDEPEADGSETDVPAVEQEEARSVAGTNDTNEEESVPATSNLPDQPSASLRPLLLVSVRFTDDSEVKTAEHTTEIIIHNPNSEPVDIAGWMLADANGVIYTFTSEILASNDELRITSKAQDGLQIGGDSLLLNDENNQTQDAISWGDDDGQLSPSIPEVTNDSTLIRRQENNMFIDTDSAADWEVADVND